MRKNIIMANIVWHNEIDNYTIVQGLFFFTDGLQIVLDLIDVEGS